MAVLDCYGSHVGALAALGGTFNPTDWPSLSAWWLRQWSLMAERMGWGVEFARAVSTAGGDKGALAVAPVAAFREWHKRRAPQFAVAGSWDKNQLARVRYDVVQALRERAGTWVIDAPSYELPYNACAGAVRVLLSSARPAYFDDGLDDPTPRGHTCEWSGNVRIYFGTWPWCHGRLDPFADGLAWTFSDTADAATLALRTAANCFEPQQNARIDARVVDEHWTRFRKRTDPAILTLPLSPQGPGSIYRDGLLLRVHLGKPELTVLTGARGPIGVAAYNYVVERFAAFWACRRAVLARYHQLDDSIRLSLQKNTDPCVREVAKPKPQIGGTIKVA